ncbi:MAG: translation initiation factor IF-2 [bacterium]
MEEGKKVITIPEVLTVRELAESFGLPVTSVIRELLKNGVLAAINDNIDFETAAIIADDLGFEVVQAKAEADAAATSDRAAEAKGEPRAPVVIVMGHVDHGKTSLLDYIRKTKVVEKESGGITQHIGAYQVEYKGRKITFLDTPGHEAFSAVRAQGTKVTDVVILVVAADEGIKPQTVEAIELARAASVPIVVAITKVDRPEINVMRVEQELSAHNIITEKWGGRDVVVEVSAKTGQGVDELLDMVLLTADMQDLKAVKNAPARGIIIETKHDIKVGYTATLLIQHGTLKVGDAFVIGQSFGRVRSMTDDTGKRIKEAGPSRPVLITGFSGTPNTSEELMVVENEKAARQVALQRTRKSTTRKVSVKTSNLSILTSQIRSAHSKDIMIVLKADVQGSLEAIKNQLAKIKTDRGQIKIVAEGIGNISESDVMSAAGENAFVIGFKVDISPSARTVAKKDNVKLLTYDVIYQLTDDLTKLLLETAGSERIEIDAGKATVVKVFRDDKEEKIVGMKVLSGKIQPGNLVKFFRDGEMVGEGKIKTIKLMNDEVKEAIAGESFGFQVITTAKIKEEDAVEFIRVEQRKASLE